MRNSSLRVRFTARGVRTLECTRLFSAVLLAGTVAVAGPVFAEGCGVVPAADRIGSDPIFNAAAASVVRLEIPGSGSCSGTLVNNALGDGRPLLLSARHCVGETQDGFAAVEPEIKVVYERRVCPAVGRCNAPHVSTRGAWVRMVWGDLILLEAA